MLCLVVTSIFVDITRLAFIGNEIDLFVYCRLFLPVDFSQTLQKGGVLELHVIFDLLIWFCVPFIYHSGANINVFIVLLAQLKASWFF